MAQAKPLGRATFTLLTIGCLALAAIFNGGSNATAAVNNQTDAPALTEDLSAPGVFIIRGSEINLVSREANLPIALKNNFENTVRVHVHVNPSNSRVVIPSSVEIEVVGGGQTTIAHVPVKAVAQGRVFLIVWLTTFSGIRLTKDSYLQMVVQPDVEFTLLLGFGALVGALGTVGVTRTVRRRRRVAASAGIELEKDS